MAESMRWSQMRTLVREGCRLDKTIIAWEARLRDRPVATVRQSASGQWMAVLWQKVGTETFYQEGHSETGCGLCPTAIARPSPACAHLLGSWP